MSNISAASNRSGLAQMPDHSRYYDDAESVVGCDNEHALLGDIACEARPGRLEPLEYSEHRPSSRHSQLITHPVALVLRRLSNTQRLPKMKKLFCFLVVFYLSLV